MIKKQNIYQHVIERLQRHIIANSLRPGDRLPTEIELAEHFGVSRQSVREAIKVMESVGIVETRPRYGSRLRRLDTQHLTDHLRFLFELDAVTIKETAAARRIIECGAMPMVIEHADARDFERMTAAIQQMKTLTRRGEVFAEPDMAFHQALVAATKNRIMNGFGVMLQEFFMHLRGHVLSNAEQQWKSIEEHERIYEALRSKDAATAQQVMEQHLEVYAHFAPADPANKR